MLYGPLETEASRSDDVLTALAIGLVVVLWVGLQVARAQRDQRALIQQIEKFLGGLGVAYVAVKYSGSYGWPGYTVTFASQAQKQAFSTSPHFEMLIQEMTSMHGKEERGGQTFDPRMALALQAVEGSAQ